MNKKVICLAVALVLCVSSFAFAATFLNMGTAGVSGVYYPVGAAMCKIWNDNISGMKANVQATGGTVQNLQLMGRGDTEVIFTDGSVFDAYNGKGKYYAEPVNFMVAKGSKIKDIAGLKGKKVAVGAVGSGSETIAFEILRAAGLDPKKDIDTHNLTHSEASRAFGDKQIDAAIIAGPVGMAGIVEATTMGLIDLVNIPDDIVKKIHAQYPYYTPFVIKANSYKGQTKPVKVFASWNIITVHEKLDTELVYKMTKSLYEHKQDLVNVSPRLNEMDKANVKYITIPLHPGAQKYYKEIKVIR
ncbi:MAG: TAXI family TRAP transporter solute-binding subunit [Synergistaceae bacterium]|nr:TAXI family TRAP transporter solute-binding subunit [Synergistaceae bacterium]